MRKILPLVLSLFLPVFLFSQNDKIYDDDPAQRRPIGMEIPAYKHIAPAGKKKVQARVEPPFWWVGMHEPMLEIMFHQKDIGHYEVHCSYPGVVLRQVDTVANPNYLFVTIQIRSWTEAGRIPFVFENGDKEIKIFYELKKHPGEKSSAQGLQPTDFIYLIMPDRFANGDPSNDSVAGMLQTGINRKKMYFRHGGDLQGIIDRLDYIKSLGVTAIWLNPVLENDQPYESYHGYAVTDHYNIDRRLGDNSLYAGFVRKCHEKGIKVIMDVVLNHCGLNHWFIQDLPEEDWIHQFDEFTRTNYRASVQSDPYVAEADKKVMTDGWFDYTMPDLNQKNKHLANYLIQNSIWWTAFSGQDAFRVDTYAYPDLDFMREWIRRLRDEFPNVGIFGETWVNTPVSEAFFAKNTFDTTAVNNLPAVTDFQLYYALIEALTRKQGWTEGIARLYYTLSNDILFKNPMDNIIFLDNHDLSRFYSMVGENMDKMKSGLALLLTLRGTPVMYYGTEIMMKNFTDPDGKVREDFPGGWKSDILDKFTAKGRTKEENEIFNYIKTLANYRLINPVLATGKFMHFIPQNGVYVYFRYNDKKTVMVILNTNDKPVTVETKRFAERLKGFSMAANVITHHRYLSIDSFTVGANAALVLELK